MRLARRKLNATHPLLRDEELLILPW